MKILYLILLVLCAANFLLILIVARVMRQKREQKKATKRAIEERQSRFLQLQQFPFVVRVRTIKGTRTAAESNLINAMLREGFRIDDVTPGEESSIKNGDTQALPPEKFFFLGTFSQEVEMGRGMFLDYRVYLGGKMAVAGNVTSCYFSEENDLEKKVIANLIRDAKIPATAA